MGIIMRKIGRYWFYWVGIRYYDDSIAWGDLFYFGITRYNNGMPYKAWRFGPVQCRKYLR